MASGVSLGGGVLNLLSLISKCQSQFSRTTFGKFRRLSGRRKARRVQSRRGSAHCLKLLTNRQACLSTIASSFRTDRGQNERYIGSSTVDNTALHIHESLQSKEQNNRRNVFERKARESGRVQEGFVCAEPTIGGASASVEVL